jgi:D-amino-acid dehydrogenase
MGKKVVILGGGIIGLCSAYHCVKAGHEVIILERGAADHDCCCRGNAGMICPSHFIPLAAPGMVASGLRMMGDRRSPFYIKPRLDWDLADWGMKFVEASTPEHVARSATVLRDLHLASRAEFLKLAKEKDFSFGLKQNGLLMLCQTAEALHHEATIAEQARALGIPAEVLTAAETAKLDPSVDLNIIGSVYFPQDCHLEPGRLLAAFTRFLSNAGVKFKWHHELTGWSAHEGHVNCAETNHENFEADEFVVAGGAHSPTTVKKLGVHLPMQAGKGYSVTLPGPPQLPKICSILTEAKVAVTPMGKSLRFGGTMEIAGLDLSINRERVQGIIDSAHRYFPSFDGADFSDLQPWSGLRPCSPDGLPYIGRTSRAKNLIIATGHAMLGLSLGPVTGRLVAQIVSGNRPDIESPVLSPDRFLGF